MPTVFNCPSCGQRLQSKWDAAAALGNEITCPTCSHVFKLLESAISKWGAIIQECRNYVPLISGAKGFGAGLLVSHTGLIVTNTHVIEGAGSLKVSFHDGTKAKAMVVHRHQDLDLAFVRASVQKDSFFDLPNRLSVGYDVGDEVVAIGHPRRLTYTATRGIISESQRTTSDGVFVQTDVAINPGNSGGPLLDALGRLVGLNTRVDMDSNGLGFAIPGHEVLDYLEDFGEANQNQQENLNAALQKLSPVHRLVFTLHDVQGLPHEEIAAIMDCNVGTVRSRLFYARQQIQAYLSDYLR